MAELLKDVAAMANSGGGVIVLGRNADGSDAGWDASLDRTEMIEAFVPFVGERFDDFSVVEASTNGSRFAVIIVPPRSARSSRLREGRYVHRRGSRARRRPSPRERSTSGTARAAPREPRATCSDSSHTSSTTNDGAGRGTYARWRQRPRDAQVLVVKPRQGTLPEVRVVDDPNAPTLARTDFDLTHPYRQTEVVRTINERVGRKLVSGYDVQCVRKVYDIADRPEFFHQPKFGSPQYSEAFVSWLVAEWRKDPEFFGKAKAVVHPKRSTRTKNGPTFPTRNPREAGITRGGRGSAR